MDAKAKREMFLYGGFGGILPTLSTVATTYVAAPETPLPAAGLYFGLFLWALVGGGVALMNSNAEHRQALFAGIAAPAIIAGVLSGAGEARRQKTGWSVIGPAYAQAVETGHDTFSASGTVIIAPEVRGGVPSSVSIPVTASVTQGGSTRNVAVGSITTLEGPTVLSLPPGTGKVFVSGKPTTVTGAGTTTIGLSVTTTPTVSGDFLWALGAQRTFRVQDVTVTPTPAKPGP